VQLPGLTIDFEQGHVDIQSEVCLAEGRLELIACTEDSKEHESIVAIKAKAMHVHTALLLLEARNGHPARRQPVNKQNGRWVTVPPTGDPIEVSLVLKSVRGKRVERPISDFVAPVKGNRVPAAERAPDAAEDGEPFPDTFLFAGSVLRRQGPGPRRYMSDVSGNVISISSFGDELLCLPGIHTRADGALRWRVDARELPEVGQPVTLRLTPRPAKAGNKP
jgi:hypothetical protein